MLVEGQNIALVRPKACLMGGKNNCFHVLVHASWGKQAQNAFPEFLVHAHKKSNNEKNRKTQELLLSLLLRETHLLLALLLGELIIYFHYY